VIAALAVLALAGCGGDDTSGTELPPGSTGTTVAGTTAPSPSASGADPVLASYLRFWDAVVAANRAADPTYAGLAAVAANPELGRVRTTVARNKVQKLSLRGEVTHTPGAPAVTGATATLQDCYDISRWNPVNLTTGERVDVTESGGTGRYKARYTLRRSGSGWLVVDQKSLGGC
jgi:hypothetical protein